VRKNQARVKTQICVIRLSYCNAKTQKTQIYVTGLKVLQIDSLQAAGHTGGLADLLQAQGRK
jgi:hypothetical protein